jgi:hypothetical protein
VEVDAVFAGLAAAAGTIKGLRAHPFVPDGVTPPTFFPAELGIDYDQTFQGGLEAHLVTCRLLVARADDRAGQKNLQGYLKPRGTGSIKAALETDRTLGGACHDLHVRRCSGYGMYEHPVGAFYLGAEFEVYVIGRGD